jgi:transcriptional regulator with XRE-family HTH domain
MMRETRDAREAVGVLVARLGSQQAVADALGYTQASVSKWCRGVTSPDLHALGRILALLKETR